MIVVITKKPLKEEFRCLAKKFQKSFICNYVDHQCFRLFLKQKLWLFWIHQAVTVGVSLCCDAGRYVEATP